MPNVCNLRNCRSRVVYSASESPTVKVSNFGTWKQCLFQCRGAEKLCRTEPGDRVMELLEFPGSNLRVWSCVSVPAVTVHISICPYRVLAFMILLWLIFLRCTHYVVELLRPKGLMEMSKSGNAFAYFSIFTYMQIWRWLLRVDTVGTDALNKSCYENIGPLLLPPWRSQSQKFIHLWSSWLFAQICKKKKEKKKTDRENSSRCQRSDKETEST